jgi:hypothetical protein
LHQQRDHNEWKISPQPPAHDAIRLSLIATNMGISGCRADVGVSRFLDAKRNLRFAASRSFQAMPEF